MVKDLQTMESSNVSGGTLGTLAGNIALITALSIFKTDFAVLGNNAMHAVTSGEKTIGYFLNNDCASSRSAAKSAVFSWVAKSISVSWLTQHAVEGIASLFRKKEPATAE